MATETPTVLVLPTEALAVMKPTRKSKGAKQPAKNGKRNDYASIAVPKAVRDLLRTIKKDMSLNSKAPWGQVLETLAQHFVAENEEIKSLKAEVAELKRTQKTALKIALNQSKGIGYAAGPHMEGPPPAPTHTAPPGGSKNKDIPARDPREIELIRELDERLTPGGTLRDWGLKSTQDAMHAGTDCKQCERSTCSGCPIAGQPGTGNGKAVKKARRAAEKKFAAAKATLEKAAREAEETGKVAPTGETFP